MNATEKESAELTPSEATDTRSAEPDVKTNQKEVELSDKDTTDTESNDLDGEAASDEAGAVSAEIDPDDEAESSDSEADPESSDSKADPIDEQQGSPEEKTSAASQNQTPTVASTVDDKTESLAADDGHQPLAAEKETASETMGSEQETVDGAEPAAESEVPAEAVNEADPAREGSQETSTPQTNAETQSKTETDAGDDAGFDSLDEEDSEDPADENAEPPPEAAASKTPIVKMAVSAALITVLFSGFFIFDNKSKISKDKTAAQAPSEDRTQPVRSEAKEIMDISPVAASSIYDDPINEVSALRDTLLQKQAEVLALKKRYQQSIDELEKEILDEQRQADVRTFLQATRNDRILFSLKTIQRREAYIRQLDKPLEWVSGACEELLYLKRHVRTDLQVSKIAAGIDMDGHVRQMHRALKRYRPTADKLAIDPTDTRLRSLEAIWQQIQAKQDAVSAGTVFSKNQIISAQICSGDFHRINELSEMTAETAECITEMRAPDLFLNQITEISPKAASQLCRWKGSWICLNGIRALSPRAAHYLFQWSGQWISLNGLTEFPSEIGEALLRWPGRQLELMGLPDTADSHARIGIEYLAEWERSGGKLFVPKNLRKEIDLVHQRSG